LQLSQLVPLASRQARAQRVDAYSLTIHGFASPVPYDVLGDFDLRHLGRWSGLG
jgi:hypothetical protein